MSKKLTIQIDMQRTIDRLTSDLANYPCEPEVVFSVNNLITDSVIRHHDWTKENPFDSAVCYLSEITGLTEENAQDICKRVECSIIQQIVQFLPEFVGSDQQNNCFDFKYVNDYVLEVCYTPKEQSLF